MPFPPMGIAENLGYTSIEGKTGVFVNALSSTAVIESSIVTEDKAEQSRNKLLVILVHVFRITMEVSAVQP